MPASSLSFDVGALESSIGFTLPCKLQVADGARYFESSVLDCPGGTIINTLVVVLGQFGVGKRPLSLQTVTAVWWSQNSVGAVPLAKYSVYVALPRGSCSHTPGMASLPDFLHTTAVSTESGTGKPTSSAPSEILFIIFRQISLWKLVPPLSESV